MVTAIGGFLFGYDTAVISGAIGFMEKHFQLSTSQTGWAGASAIVGCIPGAALAGFLSDRFGRRKVLFLCAILYAVSGIASAIPQTFGQFLLARFLGGIGIGASSMICPVYIAEIAPQKRRGRMGSLFQLGIVFGIFLVLFVNLLIQRLGDLTWNTHMGWRWMLGSETLPALLFFLLLFTVPESPRWLVVNGQEMAARDILIKLTGAEAAKQEIAAIQEVASQENGRFSELFEPNQRRPLTIALMLAVFSQFSGINAIMYYAPEIFKMTGGTMDSAFVSSVWVGLVSLVFTFVAILFVDKAGRKPLLIIGAAFQTISLAGVGYMFHTGHNESTGILLFILMFVAAFAIAMGPIPWIIISEIFPARIRGRASSVAVLTIWAACAIVAQTFPVLRESLGGAFTFWIYGACSLGSLVFVLCMLPETKGRTLEEIEASWRKHQTNSN
jgi:SP family arabinose:H+ symporter-like MFS transporter